MQKSTLEHLFEMRAVMNPDQARRFDKTVVKALTAEAR
jgi:nickel and cobalt resistance protein CnrR